MGTTPHEADVTSSNSLSPSGVDMSKKKKKHSKISSKCLNLKAVIA